jgi:S-adenosylmethionine:tRNA ribosyltransferase-isomerase
VTPAVWPRSDSEGRLLRIDPGKETLVDSRIGELPRLLAPGDLLVLNDAATLPASVQGMGPRGEALELRLASDQGDGIWTAVVFGQGDWRSRTEDRPAPPPLSQGDVLSFGELQGSIVSVSRSSPRLINVRFDSGGDSFWAALYRAGHPVQYSYVSGEVALSQVQSAFSARPWAVEPPSAGLPLSAGLLLQLRAAGVGVAPITHAAGLSSTGDAELDALLPFPERFEVPGGTVQAIARARGEGGRVVACGTTVVRALEGAARLGGGSLEPRSGLTDLKIGEGFVPRVVDGLLTGVHEPGTSHFRLLAAFAKPQLLTRAFEHAEREGYLGHEFGDSCLVLRGPRSGRPSPA